MEIPNNKLHLPNIYVEAVGFRIVHDELEFFIPPGVQRLLLHRACFDQLGRNRAGVMSLEIRI